MNQFGLGCLMAVGLLCTASQIFASPLAPGGTVKPVPAIALPGGVPILVDPATGDPGGITEGFSWNVFGKKTKGASGAYVNAVYIDPVTHDLDFYYQIQNLFKGGATGQNTLGKSFTIEDYSGFQILDVAQLADSKSGTFFGDNAGVEFQGPTNDSITSVSRSSDPGGTITVNLATVLKPGMNTSVLLLKTNAEYFDIGSSSFTWVTAPPLCKSPVSGACGQADSSPFLVGALEPFAVPEPGFYGMLSLGMGGLLFAVRRRSDVAVPVA